MRASGLRTCKAELMDYAFPRGGPPFVRHRAPAARPVSWNRSV